jgi:DNA-binding NarL/FixJ family response regulator
VSSFCADCGHISGVHEPHCTWTRCKCPSLQTKLTPTEFRVLKEMTKGKKIPEIAKIFGRSIKTIEAHRTNMFIKTGAKSIITLALGAVRGGVVKIEEFPDLGVRVFVERKENI